MGCELVSPMKYSGVSEGHNPGSVVNVHKISMKVGCVGHVEHPPSVIADIATTDELLLNGIIQ